MNTHTVIMILLTITDPETPAMVFSKSTIVSTVAGEFVIAMAFVTVALLSSATNCGMSTGCKLYT